MGATTAAPAAPPARLIVGATPATAAAAVESAGAHAAAIAVVVKMDGGIEPIPVQLPLIDPIDNVLIGGVVSHDVPWAHARWKPTQWSLASGVA